ncbi:hypothetical protein, partial [Ectothiorhodospira mobilis]|uniref:hypothetical protein n=1 Tax=Ectothiorhodospira mobilis TaxID=195064 RepID=UPI00190507C3
PAPLPADPAHEALVRQPYTLLHIGPFTGPAGARLLDTLHLLMQRGHPRLHLIHAHPGDDPAGRRRLARHAARLGLDRAVALRPGCGPEERARLQRDADLYLDLHEGAGERGLPAPLVAALRADTPVLAHAPA